MEARVIAVLLLALVAGCAPRVSSAPAPGFDPTQVDRVVVIVDLRRDLAGVRRADIEEAVRSEVTQALPRGGRGVDALAVDPRDVVGPRQHDMTPLADAEVLALGDRSGARWLLVAGIDRLDRDAGIVHASMVFRLVDVPGRRVAWAASGQDGLRFGADDEHEVVREVARRIAESLPPIGR